MAVKVNDAHGPICLVHAFQKRECDCMVPPQRDDSWKRLPFLRKSFLICTGVRLSHQDAIMAFLDLLDGVRIVVAY